MKILSSILFGLFCLTAAPAARAQTAPDASSTEAFRRYEDSLILTADSMYSTAMPEMKQRYALAFIRQLKAALTLPASYSYGFDSLAKVINILPSPDGAFRMFNWAIAPTELTRRYYGAVQFPGERLTLYGLVDCSMDLGKSAEDSSLSGGAWYGALYYRVMRNPGSTDAQPSYTLFGLNSASPLSNKKVLDILTFGPTGPRFGAPVFGIRSVQTRDRVKRFILEYKKEVQASMNWDERLQAIYFDRLMSPSGDEGRKYTFVPSGQYDGFRWNNGEWTLVKDIVPVTNLKDGDMPFGGAD